MQSGGRCIQGEILRHQSLKYHSGDVGGSLNKMAMIEHMQEFDPKKEKVSAYLERVQMFLVADSIEAEKKVSVLLTVIRGRRTRCSAVY